MPANSWVKLGDDICVAKFLALAFACLLMLGLTSPLIIALKQDDANSKVLQASQDFSFISANKNISLNFSRSMASHNNSILRKKMSHLRAIRPLS